MVESRPLLVRLLNAPGLEKVVPRLQPELIHRVVQTCGLEDCAELVALATPEQLMRVLDLDIWRVRRSDADEEFDADRFGLWLAVLMQSGAAVAAEKVVGLDIELVIAGLARHVAVFDHLAVSGYTTLDGEHVPGRTTDGGLVSEIGGYVVEARRTAAWEAIVDLLAFLSTDHPEYFHPLMRGCVQLSNGAREEDGLHDLLEDDEQQMFDLACARETRRERQGYVTPAQAHAFLRGARNLPMNGGQPQGNAIARAYFHTLEPSFTTDAHAPQEPDDAPARSSGDATSDVDANPDGVAAVVEILREAGVLNPQPRALLGAGQRQTTRLSLIQAHIATFAASGEELAYLANTVIAGCSVQGRPFTAREASDAAASICNLGLENWPPHWSGCDLITAFQVGWSILHRDVCMYAARTLVDVLAGIRCADRDIQMRLDGLRRDLIHHVRDRAPWRARNALDAIMMLDAPSWVALLGLIDECPVFHAALRASAQRCRAINPTDFEFISENGQIAAVREFMASLGTVLTA